MQTVPVEAGKATVLERILLLPEELKREELLSDAFEDLIPIPDTRFFLLAKGERAGDLFLYDWKEEKVRPLFPVSFPFRHAKILSHSVTRGSAAFLLHIESEEGEKFL